MMEQTSLPPGEPTLSATITLCTLAQEWPSKQRPLVKLDSSLEPTKVIHLLSNILHRCTSSLLRPTRSLATARTVTTCRVRIRTQWAAAVRTTIVR